MDANKKLMIEAFNNLGESDFKDLVWHLGNQMTESIEPIPLAKLEKADRHGIVDCMVQQYSNEAGGITVKVLRTIGKNKTADILESNLQKSNNKSSAPQPEQADGVKGSLFEHQWQPNQLYFKRPNSITPCSQEFKKQILREMGNDVYIPMDKYQRKRLALLINNIQFKYEKHNRYGAEKDEANMEWLLTALGYRVEKHRNLTGKEIEREVINFSKRQEHKDSDSTFVVIMSHGLKVENKEVILGVDNTHYIIEKTFENLNSEECPALIDKPKVVLIIACRGEHTGGVIDQRDSVYNSQFDPWVHREKDFVLFWSTVPFTLSYRHNENGSYFINHLVTVFCEWAHQDDIMELFRKVTSSMEKNPGREANKLLPCIDRGTLTKKFYLFPGL